MSIQFPPHFDKDLIYYLSGPMTGILNFNRQAFETTSHWLRKSGLTIKSPHELEVPPHLKERELWEHMMALCWHEVADSQAMIFMPGWLRSRGARKEMLWAISREFPLYFYDGINQIIDLGRHE